MKHCKIIHTLFLALFICFGFMWVQAQQNNAIKPNQPFNPNNPPASILCSFDQLMSVQRSSSTFRVQEMKMNYDIQLKKSNTIDTIIILPVVFHIINQNPNSITDATIINAINDLNNAFGKAGVYAGSLGIDTKIRFCLAQKAPDGGITNGINRVTSTYGDNLNMYTEDDRLKRLAQWDPQRYINVWLVNNIAGEISADFSCDTWTRLNAGGYATLPPGGGASDGIVISGFGSLFAHEMGHYLGLYHTFEGYCSNNNCETDGDRVCDTPPDGFPNYTGACTNPMGMNSCSTDTLSNYSNGFFLRDTADFSLNFMDYGNGSCANLFTLGQALRMRAAINTQRTGLLENKCSKSCTDNILAGFTRNIAVPKTGDLINFTNTSSGTNTYQWFVNDSLVGTATNLSYTFNTQGKFIVTLRASNGGTCFSSYRDEVIIGCGVIARFYTDKKTVASKTNILLDSILFTNQSLNATSYRWLMRNDNIPTEQDISTNTNLYYVFQESVQHFTRLIATNGSCSDTTNVFSVTVFDPTSEAYLYVARANCFQETKVRLELIVCNSGYKPIPPKTPVSFYDRNPTLPGAKKIDTTFIIPDAIKGRCCGIYYTHVIDIGYRKIDSLYAVVGDTGTVLPVSLPNTILKELNYTNNVLRVNNIRFRAEVSPTDTTLEPGDTLRINGGTFPDPSSTSTYLWSDAKQLNCTTCPSPLLVADSTRIKQLVVRSQYQCFDTTFVTIKVPPVNDYTVLINNANCLSKDSLSLNFTISNSYKKGVLPKNLQVTFYKGNPSTDTAVILGPVFLLSDTIFSQTQTFTRSIKHIGTGIIYASINDNGNNIRILPSNRNFSEKDSSNNISTFNYQPPATTVNITICGNDNYMGYNTTGTYTDVFTGASSCDSVRILNLTVNPVKFTGRNLAICRGDSVLLEGAWRKTRGTYTDSLKTYLGCDSVVVTDLFLIDTPYQFLPNDTVICSTGALIIDLPNYMSYQWSDGSTQNPHSLTQQGTYTLRLRNRNGCYGTDQITISTTFCVEIMIPNAFTPNGDGRNDVFTPLVPVPLPGYRLQIWNRWGMLVFETSISTKGWDGTLGGQPQPAGTYVYKMAYKTPTGQEKQKAGTLVMIR
ncbi:MAG: gliding motility-associated C-terminal domain-containing protein [Bacteroidota bacterium]